MRNAVLVDCISSKHIHKKMLQHSERSIRKGITTIHVDCEVRRSVDWMKM